MKVFLTGATGFVGSAVLRELISAGHTVTGLARDDEGAAKLKAAGAGVHLGDLKNIGGLLEAVRSADGVIHNAFIHDFSNFLESTRIDTAVVEAMGNELAGSGRPMVIASGIGILPAGQMSTEETRPDPASHAAPRLKTELAIDAAASRSVRASVVRLPPSVHDHGDHGFVPALISMARAKGESAYIGEGLNRWPSVHRPDAARLFRLALEGGTPGARYHAIGDQGILFREIAAVIGRKLNIPVVSKTGNAAKEHFSWIAGFAGMDVPATSFITEKALGWKATGLGLLEDLETGDYFGTKG